MIDWQRSMQRQQTPDGRPVVLYPPGLIQNQNNQTFAVSGCVWIEVAAGTTLEEAQELFCWGEEGRKYWDPKHSEANGTYQVKGSKGNMYTVTQRGNVWNCECRGYQFRRDCKHIQNLRKEKES